MKGLYDKYKVSKDGKPVEGRCFILKPETDPAALKALGVYALETDNFELARDLLNWINEIEPAA